MCTAPLFIKGKLVWLCYILKNGNHLFQFFMEIINSIIYHDVNDCSQDEIKYKLISFVQFIKTYFYFLSMLFFFHVKTHNRHRCNVFAELDLSCYIRVDCYK